jgi:hypothetical protein
MIVRDDNGNTYTSNFGLISEPIVFNKSQGMYSVSFRCGGKEFVVCANTISNIDKMMQSCITLDNKRSIDQKTRTSHEEFANPLQVQ